MTTHELLARIAIALILWAIVSAVGSLAIADWIRRGRGHYPADQAASDGRHWKED